MKKVAPAPPYGSGISTPMIPSSKQASMSSRGILDSSSIVRTRGRTFSSAKSRTTSRKAFSSSERSVSGRLRSVSTIGAPRPSMLARFNPPRAAAAPRPR